MTRSRGHEYTCEARDINSREKTCCEYPSGDGLSCCRASGDIVLSTPAVTGDPIPWAPQPAGAAVIPTSPGTAAKKAGRQAFRR
jgi:hypothetical protein